MDPEAYFAAMDLPGYEMLVFAPRGTGESSKPRSPDGYRIAGYVADVESLRSHLGLDRLTLYGNSHGAMVTLAYATSHPERVARFILTNGPARMDDRYRQAVAATKVLFAARIADGASRLAAADAASEAIENAASDRARYASYRSLMARYVARQGPAETEYLNRLCTAPMNWAAGDVMYEELLGGLDLLVNAAAVGAPALVIAGELDVTVPPDSMRVIAEALPNARYVEFPGVGHFVEVEAADELRRVVCAFLAE
jgi:pimeloyl-ACP methyl ester carboxylesterase